MFGFKRKAKKPPEREIFRYWDGFENRRIDPMLAQLSLETHPQYDDTKHPELVDAGDTEALMIVVSAVSDVFGIPPLTEDRGLTVLERLEVIQKFYEYLETLKKNTSPSPTPSSPLEEIYTRFTGTAPGSASSDSGIKSPEPKPGTPIDAEPPWTPSGETEPTASRSRSDSSPPPTKIQNEGEPTSSDTESLPSEEPNK